MSELQRDEATARRMTESENAECAAFASEMERIKQTHWGKSFLTDMLLAVAHVGGFTVVDKGERDALLAGIKGAAHALRSYQYGNSSPELARSAADALDAIIDKKGSGA